MKQNYTLIKNAKLVREDKNLLSDSDILLRENENGENIIERIAQRIPESELPEASLSVYDAKGRLALPGFIDMHVHLREPGFEYKEDIASGTAAAAAGGVAAVVAMPNTKPVCDNIETFEYIKRRASRVASCRVLPSAAITKGQAGLELVDFDALHEAGAVAFTDDGRPVENSALLLEAMKKCAERDYLIISHCENMSLARGGAINEGRVSKLLKVKGIPNLAEDLSVAHDILIAEETGCRLHVAHVSTRGSLDLIRRAKARGVRVTCETCPHYFAFTEDDVVFYGANAKMNPPLRSRDDVAAVIEAIKDGTIDCISTDHAPHSEAEKSGPLEGTPNGIIGLQTSFSAALTYLVLPGHITMRRLVELMCKNPADILGIDGVTGRITEGERASFSIISSDTEYILTSNMLKGKSKNTPFLGLSLRGMVERIYF